MISVMVDTDTRIAATIATRSHLGLAHCLATSFLHHHANAVVYVLLVDSDHLPSAFDDLAAVGIPASDLRLDALPQMRARYSAFELCNALKPSLLSHLIGPLGHEQVVYLDSDLYIVDNLDSSVFAALDTRAVLVTPHLVKLATGQQFAHRDLVVLQGGALNGGFMGIRRTPQSEQMLAWWASRTERQGYFKLDEGMNCDQRWLDLLPGFDLDVEILRDPGLNIAYWNLDERHLGLVDGRHVCNGEPVGFVHFSGFRTDEPGSITKNWTRHTLATRPDLVPLAEEYRVALRASTAAVSSSSSPPPAPASPSVSVSVLVPDIVAPHETSWPQFGLVEGHSAPWVATTSLGSTAASRSDKYNAHVACAYDAFRATSVDVMAEQLAASAVWSDAEPSALPLEWVRQFQRLAEAESAATIDVLSLTSKAAWQNLVRLDPKALLEKGVAAREPAPNAASKSPFRPVIAAVGQAVPKLDLRHAGNELVALRRLHVDGGIVVDGFVERTFLEESIPARTEPWVGFVHNPAGLPKWFPQSSCPEGLLADPRFVARLATCAGLFAPTETLRAWWSGHVGVPVDLVRPPTRTPTSMFSMDAFRNNPLPRIVQLTTWAAKYHAIHLLPVRKLRRTLVDQFHTPATGLLAAELRLIGQAVEAQDVDVLTPLDAWQLDELLRCNVVFCELYGAAANETILACLAAATPIIVNPLPAVVELFGREYPLYFASRTEAARKANDDILIEAAHRYLLTLPQRASFDPSRFVDAVATSGIYRNLPSRKR